MRINKRNLTAIISLSCLVGVSLFFQNCVDVNAFKYMKILNEMSASNNVSTFNNMKTVSVNVEPLNVFFNSTDLDIGNQQVQYTTSTLETPAEVGLGSTGSCTGSNCIIDGINVTACSMFGFLSAPDNSVCSVRYKFVAKVGDAQCSDTYCQTSPGLVVFARPDDTAAWKLLSTIELTSTKTTHDLWIQKSFSMPLGSTSMLVCRAGGGSARDQVVIQPPLLKIKTTEKIIATAHNSGCTVPTPTPGDIRQQLIYNNYKNFLNFQPNLQKTNFGDLGYYCMYFTNMAKRYGAECGVSQADQIGQYMMSNADLNKNNIRGWGLPNDYNSGQTYCTPGTYDAFGDGTCNPIGTEYIFQTGLVLDCLGQLYEVTGNSEYLDFVKTTIDQTWNIGTSNISNCSDCFHYWYSYNKNDFDRYVRNTNIEMIPSLAFLTKYVDSPDDEAKYRLRLEQILRFERSEYNLGNRGYLGSLDPNYINNPSKEQWRNEDHMPSHIRYISRFRDILQNKTQDTLASKLAYDWEYCPGNTWCATTRQNQLAGAAIIQSGEIDRYTDSATTMNCSGYGSNAVSKSICDHEITDLNAQNLTVNLNYLLYIIEGM